MDEIINLLNEKNSCLEKFYNLNEKEMQNFINGNFDNLESFYECREGILNMIRRVDEMIDIASLSFEESNDQPEATVTEKVAVAMQTKNKMIERILEQDLEILSTIDQAKSEIIRELAQTRMAKKAVTSYRSEKRPVRLTEED